MIFAHGSLEKPSRNDFRTIFESSAQRTSPNPYGKKRGILKVGPLRSESTRTVEKPRKSAPKTTPNRPESSRNRPKSVSSVDFCHRSGSSSDSERLEATRSGSSSDSGRPASIGRACRGSRSRALVRAPHNASRLFRI